MLNAAILATVLPSPTIQQNLQLPSLLILYATAPILVLTTLLKNTSCLHLLVCAAAAVLCASQMYAFDISVFMLATAVSISIEIASKLK